MMGARIKQEGRVYLRRSSSGQESSLATQLQWAIDKAKDRGVPLAATLADLEHMQHHRLASYRGIYLDDAVSGGRTKRPGFDAMLAGIRQNQKVSHLFVFKRDRLGRPRDPLDMMVVERDLRSWGVMIEMSDGFIDPSEQGTGALGQKAMSLFGYFESGEFSKKLSERIVLVQVANASRGYSAGGRPPYGFGRFLVDASGRVVEELQARRKVKEPGCHVRFLPTDESKIGVWVRILEWLETGWGYKRVAEHLNKLGIPAPDIGRVRGGRTFAGRVSGKWNHNTVRSLAMNPLIIGEKEYGRFSRGMHFRVGPGGPRAVSEDELFADGSGRVIENDSTLWIRADSGGGAFFDNDRWHRLQAKLTERGQAQRGKRRASDPNAYPLATRVFDLTDGCGSIMQGAARRDRGEGRPTYRCGVYMKRQGECHHNTVDAEALLRFAVSTIATIVKRAAGMEKLRAAIRARIEALAVESRSPEQAVREELVSKVQRLRRQVEQAPRRILEEEDEAMRAQLRSAARDLSVELADAEQQLDQASSHGAAGGVGDIEEEVQKAMDLLQRVEIVCADPVARGELPRVLDDLGLRIGLNFRAGITNNRPARVLQGGIMAFGNRLLPCPLRTSGGRPIVGGQPPQEHGHAHDQHPDGGCDGRHEEHFGKAQSPAGSRTAPSRRRGKSTETNDPSRGGGVGTSVDAKNPRQPTRTGRLSKGNSSGRT